MRHRDPLANSEPLIRSVYAFVAYRVGEARAEDVTSTVFERALRYRSRFDPQRGEPLAWLLGIARRCIADSIAAGRHETVVADDELQAAIDGHGAARFEDDAIRRVTVLDAIAALDHRDRELIALRYGADLTARQIAELLEMKTNAVEVALHRALARLRKAVSRTEGDPERGVRDRPRLPVSLVDNASNVNT